MVLKLILLFKLLCKVAPILLVYFLCISLFYIIYIKERNERKDAYENKDFYILKMLDYIYIKNIWLELSFLILIFINTIGFITLLRFINLGKTYIIWDLFTYKSKNTPNLVIVIILIIVMFFYIKILHILLKHTFYKINLYFYKKKYYFKTIDLLWWKGNNVFSIITKIYINLNTIFTNKQHNSDSLLLIYLKRKIQFNDKLRILFQIIYNYCSQDYNFGKIEECFYYYLPHIFVFFVLLYDLKHNELKYFYFIIFIFFIINSYRKFKLFISQLNLYEIDKILSEYFYNTTIHSQLIIEKNYHKRFNLICKDGFAWNIYNNYKDQIQQYIQRNYIVDYIDINFKKSYEPYNFRLLYLGIFTLYISFGYNTSFINCILISTPLILTIIGYEYNFHNYKTKKEYIIKYILLYILLLTVSTIIIIWIYLTRHTLFFMNDFVWNYKYPIEQYFSIEEKLTFIKEYFMLKMKHLSINDKIYLLKIFKNIPFYDLLQNSTIDEIKNYIDNLIKTYERMENNIYPILKDYVQDLYNIENRKEETVNDISTYILIMSISIIYYIYIL